LINESLIYGPVPSRRLGLSLGIDPVPFKLCTYDCIYCQLGRTTEKTTMPRPCVPIDKILEQLHQKLREEVLPDYISIGGSGEPTLNSDLGLLIGEIRKSTSIPIAVLTNGSLFKERKVRESLAEADVVLPSLDAYDQSGFETINRPHSGIRFEEMVEGLIMFGREYSGEIWLELFILEGINATEADAFRFKHWVDRVNARKVHVNTAVRPSAESYALQVPMEGLERFCEILGKNAEVIAPFKRSEMRDSKAVLEQEIVDLLARRPCTLDDISSGLHVNKHEVLKHVTSLLGDHTIRIMKRGTDLYYQKGDTKQS
jgi:wyosine [tRNA(Phe)-imidazoG37] synthetase (radical SAM superfamily)